MTLNFISYRVLGGGLFIHIKQSAAGASLKSPSYEWSHLLLSERPCVEMCVRRWIWSRIGCNRSRVKNIADGNKRSSYVFLAIWIPLQCNFTGKSLCFLFLLSVVYTHTHARTQISGFFFACFLLLLCSQSTFVFQKHSRRSDCFDSIDSYFREALLLLNQISIYTRPCPITLNYEWTHVFFSDDNRDECHLLLTTRCNWAVTHAVHNRKLSIWIPGTSGMLDKCHYPEGF